MKKKSDIERISFYFAGFTASLSLMGWLVVRHLTCMRSLLALRDDCLYLFRFTQCLFLRAGTFYFIFFSFPIRSFCYFVTNFHNGILPWYGLVWSPLLPRSLPIPLCTHKTGDGCFEISGQAHNLRLRHLSMMWRQVDFIFLAVMGNVCAYFGPLTWFC